MLVPLAVFLTISTLSHTPTTAPANDEPLNALKATPNDVHALLIDEGEQIQSGKVIQDDDFRIYISRVINADFPFNELVPSWNVKATKGAGFSVYVRLGRRENEFWTPFYYFGTWGRVPSNTRKLVQDPHGVVRIDHFQSKEVFDRIQYRIESTKAFTIHRFALAYSNTLNDPHLAKQHRCRIDPGSHEKWTRRLPVPFQSQSTNDESMRGRLCSPISVAMVTAYRGIDETASSICVTVFDPEYSIYGNWSRAVQAAYTFGMPGYLERFNDWNQVKRYIAADQPIIASIKIKKGQLHSDPKRESSGHLLVITGFDEQGNVHVNDPAYREEARGRTIYNQQEMDDIWFANGGVGYVLEKP